MRLALGREGIARAWRGAATRSARSPGKRRRREGARARVRDHTVMEDETMRAETKDALTLPKTADAKRTTIPMKSA